MTRRRARSRLRPAAEARLDRPRRVGGRERRRVTSPRSLRARRPGSRAASRPRCESRASRPGPAPRSSARESTVRPRASVSSRLPRVGRRPRPAAHRRRPRARRVAARSARRERREATDDQRATRRIAPRRSSGTRYSPVSSGISPACSELALAAAQHPQGEDRRPEQRRDPEAELDAEHALAGPVDVVELEQQRRLVEGEPDPGAERDREDLLEPVAVVISPAPPAANASRIPGTKWCTWRPPTLTLPSGHQPLRMPQVESRMSANRR